MNPLIAFKALSKLQKIGVIAGIIAVGFIVYSIWISDVKTVARKEGAQTVIIENLDKAIKDAANVNKATNDFNKRGGATLDDCVRDARNPEDCDG